MEDDKTFNGMSVTSFRDLLNRIVTKHVFYVPSWHIYEGENYSGFFDYGPAGVKLRDNVLEIWKQHFILEEDMLEVDSAIITPQRVLKASGHVDNFTDSLVKDIMTGKSYRADHLLKDYCKNKLKDPEIRGEEVAEFQHLLNRVDNITPEEISTIFKTHNILAPGTNNTLSEPEPHNLMFATKIGQSSKNRQGYLRPETAQGIFVNFKELYKVNGEKLPFAAAQIGRVFRNEASARQGPLRVREFDLAEIEHFVHPDNKTHRRFCEVKNIKILMLPRDEQLEGKSAKWLCIGDAVDLGTIASETLGYFIGRAYLFLRRLGIHEKRLRFRQHMPREMAHYAAHCWDGEIYSSYGWVECVGVSDRGDFDLTAHSRESKIQLVALEKLDEPIERDILHIHPNKRAIGKTFGKDHKTVVNYLQAMREEVADNLISDLERHGEGMIQVEEVGTVKLTKDMLHITKKQKLDYSKPFKPHVIEPGFGIGRIVFCVLENLFSTWKNKDSAEQLCTFRFSSSLAPYKCLVLPKENTEVCLKCVERICKMLKIKRIVHKRELSGLTNSYPKRVAKADELGAPFAIIACSESDVYIRERGIGTTICVPEETVVHILKDLLDERITWESALKKYTINKSPRPSVSFLIPQTSAAGAAPTQQTTLVNGDPADEQNKEVDGMIKAGDEE